MLLQTVREGQGWSQQVFSFPGPAVRHEKGLLEKSIAMSEYSTIVPFNRVLQDRSKQA